MSGYINGKVEIWYGDNPPSNQNVLWQKRIIVNNKEYSSMHIFNNSTWIWEPISNGDYYLNKSIENSLKSTQDLNDKIFVDAKNLFNIADLDVVFGEDGIGKWIPSTSETGELEDLSLGEVLTGFIPVNDGDVIYSTLKDQTQNGFSGYIAVFDENKNIITQNYIIKPTALDPIPNAYIVKPGEKYIRIAFRNEGITKELAEQLIVSKNEQIFDYVPYFSENTVDIKTIDLPNTSTGKTIVRFGDSLTEFDETTILSDLTGANVINVGIGGTRMAKNITPSDYDFLSMYEISEAIISGDWSNQISAAKNILEDHGDDNTTIVNKMSLIDFSKVDIITIWFGTNDLTGGNLIGTNSDNDGMTIKGAMNKIITNIYSLYPHIQLIFITPIYREIENISCDIWTNGNGYKLIDIVKAEEELCLYRHVPFISIFNSSCINNDTISFFLKDGTHPNNFGYRRILSLVSKSINCGIFSNSTTNSILDVGQIPEYSTNELAIAGGLIPGNTYHTSGTLKIVI